MFKYSRKKSTERGLERNALSVGIVRINRECIQPSVGWGMLRECTARGRTMAKKAKVSLDGADEIAVMFLKAMIAAAIVIGLFSMA